ncbi:hypothetical protein D4764_12G0008170 [Takifugu flavidus]|uniref:Uncharacterized protein n=1 Tax=Takifugu flavidus TaxID=433684 RepID=A0A5C6PGE2_9TELE|nr:hypothetical protein D4764_12G0008170 [Takifugu flavidus]
MDRCRVHITADAAPIRLSISCSILPSLVNKTLRYLNSSTCGRISSLTRTTASDLEDHIICKKQRPDPEVTKLDPLNTMTAPRNSVQKIMNRICDKGQPWRRPTLTGNEQRPDTPEDSPQDPPRETVECLLQVHKTHVDWLGKLPCTLEDPAEGIELVHCSTPRTKTTLLFLNLRFDYLADPPIQYP